MKSSIEIRSGATGAAGASGATGAVPPVLTGASGATGAGATGAAGAGGTMGSVTVWAPFESTSRRGQSAPAFRICFSSSRRHAVSSSRSDDTSRVSPIRRKISAADDGHHGQEQDGRNADGFGASYSTALSSSARAGSFASAQGWVSAMNTFVGVNQVETPPPPPRGARSGPWRDGTSRRPRRPSRRASVAPRRPARRPPRYRSAIAGNAAHQVAEVVGEVGVVPLFEAIPREIAVAAVRHFLDEIQAQRIRTEALCRVERVDDRCRATCSCARP